MYYVILTVHINFVCFNSDYLIVTDFDCRRQKQDHLISNIKGFCFTWAIMKMKRQIILKIKLIELPRIEGLRTEVVIHCEVPLGNMKINLT